MILFRCYSLTFPCLLCNQPSRDIIRTKTDCASSGCLREAVQLQPRVNESRFPASIFVAIQFTVIAIFSFRASSLWTPPVVRPSPLVEPSCQRHRTLQSIGGARRWPKSTFAFLLYRIPGLLRLISTYADDTLSTAPTVVVEQLSMFAKKYILQCTSTLCLTLHSRL
jgi:hypothetical protein